MGVAIERLAAGGGWLTGILLATAALAGDWPAWRGPLQTGVSLDQGLPSSTKDVQWQVPFGGRSAPAIVGGRVFGIDLAGEGIMAQERVFAIDLSTGHPLWQYNFAIFHTDVPESRVGWSSVAVDPETGNVYAQGVQGLFLCLDRDGKLVWSKSLTELYGRISGYGGRTHTPVVDEDRVIISFNNSSFGAHGIGAHRYLAMDKRTGEVRWWSAPGGRPLDTNYSTPVVAVIDGQRLLIGGNADGSIYAIKSRTGEKVWGYKFCHGGVNTSMVVDGYKVYATHSDESEDTVTMGRVVCFDGRGQGDISPVEELHKAKPGEATAGKPVKDHDIWRRDGIAAGYASPLLHAGRLYVMANSGMLHCLNADNGKEIWQFNAGRIGKGSPVWADGKLYVTTADGVFEILEDTGDECRRLDKVKFHAPIGNVDLFGSPAVGDSRVVCFTATELICWGGKDPKPQPTAALNLSAEDAAETQPAVLQVRPAEVVLAPGAKMRFEAVAFDKHGRKIGPVEAAWTYGGKGSTVAADGAFQAGHKGSIGEVTAKAGALSGTARVRIVPPLPISEDFESYQGESLVGWWVGVSKGKYAIETLDGSRVLKKISDDRGPIFNRSHVFITPPLPTGYTVEADVLGDKKGDFRGEVGLINARYVLEINGMLQRLRVMSWIPGPRFEKKMDFNFEPNRWYRLKFEVQLAGNEARVKGKVWPRDQAEPAAWTLEAVDPQPNREGSPGLYANSTLAPLYFDNVKIYRQK